MLSRQEIEERLIDNSASRETYLVFGGTPPLELDFETEALETALRLWIALEDEILGYGGPFLPLNYDKEQMKEYDKGINAWSDRRHEHWSWFGRI